MKTIQKQTNKLRCINKKQPSMSFDGDHYKKVGVKYSLLHGSVASLILTTLKKSTMIMAEVPLWLYDPSMLNTPSKS